MPAKVTVKKPVDKDAPPVEVFVYGTLKKGFALHGWMNGSKFTGYDTLPGHTLLDLGPYPALIKVLGGLPGDFKAQGELYQMPADKFDYLRQMEENAGYKTADVITRKGVKAKAFVWQELTPGLSQWESDGRSSQVVVHIDDDIPF